MQELYQQIISILYGVWRKRHYALIVSWVVCIAGWMYVAQIPNKYQSSARIHVDAETMLKPLMKGLAVSNNVYDQVRMMRQTLISRPNIEKVIRMTDLDMTVTSESETEKLVEALSEDININIQGAANLFQISYENSNPAVAKKVVQSLLNIFIEDKLATGRKDLSSALRFIEEQIREYEEQMEIAEQRTAEFKQKNMSFLSGQGSSYFDQMQQAQSAVAVVKNQINEYRNKQKQMKAYLENIPPYLASGSGTGPAIGGAGPSSSSNLANRISILEQRLDDLYARGYKDQHPDVKIIAAQIGDLQGKMAEEQAELAQALEEGDTEKLQSTAGVRPNPVYDQLNMNIIELEGEIASLQARLAQKEDEVKRLASYAQRVPEVEAELARLNRDYGIIKRNYNELLEKRESARISQDLETKSDRVQFRVIEPPQEAREPSSPNRLLYVLGVLFVGLGAGVGVAFLMSQMHSTFSTEQRLRDVLSMPVLGSISAIPSPQELQGRKRKLILFSIMLAGLFISCISVYAMMNYFHVPTA
ncbi:XrtA system polysaccharide chain length determinant [Emcibacter sp.]|uniref:XrtA system polysaccharide chain length determinant n=1 Tax=Emcibacter sp. TaxID=1979954 RepID=UPI002AA93E90|nr:XrtA system polysaccharide chain length determinant [Emcibacter sp.]